MTFGAAVQSCLSKYAVFRGRAPRSEFWWFWVFTILVEVAAAIIGVMLFTSSVSEHAVVMGPGMSSMSAWYVYAAPNWLSGVTHLLLILPSFAVAVRRLHDVGRSGWWLLIVFLPFIGFLVLLFWWVQPSEPRDNAYGPSPLPLLPRP